jgi:hypothetical protein
MKFQISNLNVLSFSPAGSNFVLITSCFLLLTGGIVLEDNTLSNFGVVNMMERKNWEESLLDG